jgi:hypothetical protein
MRVKKVVIIKQKIDDYGRRWENIYSGDGATFYCPQPAPISEQSGSFQSHFPHLFGLVLVYSNLFSMFRGWQNIVKSSEAPEKRLPPTRGPEWKMKAKSASSN